MNIEGAGHRIGSSTLCALLVSTAAFVIMITNPASALEVSSKAAVIMDSASHKILVAKNPDLRLAPASTTKLMTAMVVLDYLKPDEVVQVSRDAAWTPSVKPKLVPGQMMSVQDLLYLALMRSINGAAVALAEAVAGSEKDFTALMNEKAAEIGAANTRFINATGLPGFGQYITAYDLALIMLKSLEYPEIKEIISTRVKLLSTERKDFFLTNTDRLLWSEEGLIGGKTGYTRAARHCFTFAAEKGEKTYVGALLGERVRQNLWQDAENLLTWSCEIDSAQSAPYIIVDNAKGKSAVGTYASYERPKQGKRLRKTRRLHHARLRKPVNKEA